MSIIRDILEEIRTDSDQPQEMSSSSTYFPLYDEEDQMIVMHREAHFGGSFDVMIGYYLERGKGAMLSLKRIRELAAIEKRTEEDLAETLLADVDRQHLERVQTAYRRLREIYELEKEETPHPRLISDLILSEESDEETALQALADRGAPTISDLISLLRAVEFADSTFPGYGFAPALAARALGKIGAADAIEPLFESIGSELDEEAISALRSIGGKAKTFLLERLKSKPLTPDTERAAAALSVFDDDEVASCCCTLLCDVDYLTKVPLSIYLVIASRGAPKLKELLDNPHLPSETREEIEAHVKSD